MSIKEIVERTVADHYGETYPAGQGQILTSIIVKDEFDYSAERALFYGGCRPEDAEVQPAVGAGEVLKSIVPEWDDSFDYEAARADFLGASRVVGQTRTDKSKDDDDYESLRNQFHFNHR